MEYKELDMQECSCEYCCKDNKDFDGKQNKKNLQFCCLRINDNRHKQKRGGPPTKKEIINVSQEGKNQFEKILKFKSNLINAGDCKLDNFTKIKNIEPIQMNKLGTSPHVQSYHQVSHSQRQRIIMKNRAKKQTNQIGRPRAYSNHENSEENEAQKKIIKKEYNRSSQASPISHKFKIDNAEEHLGKLQA